MGASIPDTISESLAKAEEIAGGVADAVEKVDTPKEVIAEVSKEVSKVADKLLGKKRKPAAKKTTKS